VKNKTWIIAWAICIVLLSVLIFKKKESPIPKPQQTKIAQPATPIQATAAKMEPLPQKEKPAEESIQTTTVQPQAPISNSVTPINQDQPQQTPLPLEQKVEQKPAENPPAQEKTGVAEKQKKLPEDFMEVLAEHGKWVEDSEYGKVWVPNSNKEQKDWKPYQDGTWQDYSNGNYCWYSNEPFGYIAYHYGWWQWSPIWSWYWIPGYVWGPAWVNWYWYGNYAYWSPMWYDYRYYNRYYDRCYSHSNGIGWSAIHKSQLRDPNLSRAVRTTNQRNSIAINSSRITPNVRITNTQTRALGSNPQSRTSSNITKSFPSRTPTQNRLADSPWSNDSRNKIQSTPRSSLPRIFNTPRYSASPSSRNLSPTRTTSPQSRSFSGQSRISVLSRTSAPRSASPSHGGNIHRR